MRIVSNNSPQRLTIDNKTDTGYPTLSLYFTKYFSFKILRNNFNNSQKNISQPSEMYSSSVVPNICRYRKGLGL